MFLSAPSPVVPDLIRDQAFLPLTSQKAALARIKSGPTN